MTFSFERAVPEPRRRGFITRMAILYTVISAACAALVVLALINIVSGNTGYVVMLCVFGLVGFLTTYWMLAYVRDLRAEPITIEGEI